MTSTNSTLEPPMNIKTGRCTQCGTFNTETLRCNCANKALDTSVGISTLQHIARLEPEKIGLKFDNDKLLYSLIPPETTKALAEVLTFGAKKYAPGNWAKVENGEERYLNALFRHLEAYRSGEDLDPESNFSHLAHCMCNIAFIHHFQQKRLSGV